MKVLLLSPHTDDVELGAGGLICRMLEDGGHTFKWLVFSRCSASLGSHLAPDTLENEFHRCADFLGISDRQVLDYGVRTMPDHRQEVLETLVQVKADFQPDLVLGPCLEDVHQDHSTIARESLRAFKNCATILGYELPWNNVSFSARMLVRLTRDHTWRKWQAMQHYESQQTLRREYFSWDFVSSWAVMVGAQCGAQYGEAFEVIRAVF